MHLPFLFNLLAFLHQYLSLELVTYSHHYFHPLPPNIHSYWAQLFVNGDDDAIKRQCVFSSYPILKGFPKVENSWKINFRKLYHIHQLPNTTQKITILEACPNMSLFAMKNTHTKNCDCTTTFGTPYMSSYTSTTSKHRRVIKTL